MFRFWSFLLGLLCLSALLVSCEDEIVPTPDPKPEPQACFKYSSSGTPGTQSSPLVDSAEIIALTNCSQNADSFLWLIDTVRRSTDRDIFDLQFFSRGEHTIQLIAYQASTGLSDTSTLILYVGLRTIASFVVSDYTNFRALGQPWDDDLSPPDLLIAYGPNTFPYKYVTKFVVNPTGPTELAMPTPTVISNDEPEKNNSSWSFTIIDYDQSGQHDTMATFTGIYPSSAPNPTLRSNSADPKVSLRIRYGLLPG